ncbi:MAG: tryptophan-rich sensory protein [Saprospiraceae bacterium]|nr:tryptophan-rich sensory protein [Pyrinomonadaceae bacterium]
MTENASGTDKFRAVLVLAATIGMIAFNWLAAAGNVGGVTPEAVSNRYPTLITPAGYAFAIWSLIYLGMAAFSIYQLIPANIFRFRSIRSLYITSCALNCAWIFFWHGDQIAICLAIITALLVTLLLIASKLRVNESVGETWAAKVPFGIYAGWVTAATLVNFAVLLVYLNVQMSRGMATILAVALILFAALMGVLIRIKLANYVYPLAIAWALTAIAVKQSGQTSIVVAAAAGVIACLIACLSLVMNLRSSQT